ncbi:YheC/YheD family protein [Paenibacillus yanchengensis]|uniref:YheC/YheD family protein n=1 Tax=Paenibacillus yanchengensis TaxID=2035833 RepID=A0ABW4YLI1_9BACL
MSKSKVAIGIAPSTLLQSDAVILSESVMKRWNIPATQSVTLQFGSWYEQIRIIPAAKQKGIMLNTTLAKTLAFHRTNTPTYIHLKYIAETKTLQLGPIIGILVSKDFPDDLSRPFGAISRFCLEVSEAAHAQGAYVFFFTPKHMRIDTHSVFGWTYHDHWQQKQMPIPHVIYNRLSSRKIESSPTVQQFWKFVTNKYNTTIFNEQFLDKTEVFQALEQHGTVRTYLPESKPLASMNTLKQMSNKYSTLFVKPVEGSMGRGIIRITADTTNGYQVQRTTNQGTRHGQYTNLTQLYTRLFRKKTTKYQVQQGLRLIEVQKRPVDFRVLAQKNHLGEWSITSTVARIAGSQHFVSNIARGGTLSRVEEAISKSNILTPNNGLELITRLKHAAMQIAKAIDKQLEAHFAELGIDFAVDRFGRIWLLEVNSKPSKNDNTPLKDGKIRPSVKKMIAYAKYISEF